MKEMKLVRIGSSSITSPKLFDRWFHFDSDFGDSIDIDISINTPWIMTVSYIYFELDGIVWEDPTAFICFHTNNLFSQSVITQTYKGKSDIVLPIRSPMDKPTVDAYAIGIPHNERVSFTPQIMDAHQNAVEIKRLVVTFHIQSQCQEK